MVGCFGTHGAEASGTIRDLQDRPCLDVHMLQRQGVFSRAGEVMLRLGSCSNWPETGEIDGERGDGGCLLASHTPGNLRIGNQTLPVRPHRLGMAMFGCPRCDRDCRQLYEVDGLWACRLCHHLNYRCRHTLHRVPGFHRIVWLRRRLGVNPRPFTVLLAKSPRFRRYWRLAREIRRLEANLIEHGGAVASTLEKRIASNRKRPRHRVSHKGK